VDCRQFADGYGALCLNHLDVTKSIGVWHSFRMDQLLRQYLLELTPPDYSPLTGISKQLSVTDLRSWLSGRLVSGCRELR
jgi:hypothetical protein